jgi:hypothetical protein
MQPASSSEHAEVGMQPTSLQEISFLQTGEQVGRDWGGVGRGWRRRRLRPHAVYAPFPLASLLPSPHPVAEGTWLKYTEPNPFAWTSIACMHACMHTGRRPRWSATAAYSNSSKRRQLCSRDVNAAAAACLALACVAWPPSGLRQRRRPSLAFTSLRAL